MFQSIFPHVFSNAYSPTAPSDDSPVIVADKNAILVNEEGGRISFPTLRDFDGLKDAQYLFDIDGSAFFGITDGVEAISKDLPEGFRFADAHELRACSPKYSVFAGVTGWRLTTWYSDNKFCGRCGSRRVHSVSERALICPECGSTVYPRIDPAVIIGVTDKDRLLLTKYSGRSYKRYALVAGYCETGETAEETVRREVMEEVGLKVDNIRYYKSQPWPFSGSLLFGYFCDVTGSREIRRDPNELSEAEWRARDEIDIKDDGVSLTNEMIAAFKEGNYES